MTVTDGPAAGGAALAQLARLCEELTGARGAPATAELICRHLLSSTDSDYCRIWWVTTARDEARVLAHVPTVEFTEPWEHRKSLTDATRTIVSEVIGSGVARFEPDAARAAGVESRYASVYKVKSGVHLPIVVAGRVCGDLVCCSKRETNHYSPADGDLYALLSSITALALARYVGDRAFAGEAVDQPH